MDYSKTVNLPTTDFPMKANLPGREPEMIKQWEKMDIYQHILESRKDADLYILHDGPPYANGHIHTGHALNKILKDIIVKHKTMMGFKSPYVPGWDCHGLPIELEVIKKLGKEINKEDKLQVRKLCREYAGKFVAIQMEEFRRLGVFGDYENPYLTMSKEYEAIIVEVFGKIHKEGFITRSKKPIYWCPTCVTALAEAEVEYDNHVSPSIYVKFKAEPFTVTMKGVDPQSTFVVIWTTTPWTLPANLAVSFHPDFEYAAYKFGSEHYIIAQGLLPSFEKALGRKSEQEVPVPTVSLKSLKVKHPFIDRESKIIFGTHVTLEQGTGIVHTAPGHGYEDYIVGLEYGLDIYCPVNDYGAFTKDFPEMEGVNIFDANEKIVRNLQDTGYLLKRENVEHSYPHCWRCKKPLIFRATEQWFFKIDHKNLRDLAMKCIDDTQWVPVWGESRFRSMVETRPDWCLSRQRSWGVPIPSFRCAKCNTNMMTWESVLHFSKIAKEKSIDDWYTEDIHTLIPDGTRCQCGSDEFIKEFDILDVWFDSGVSHFVVLDNWKNHRWPSDIYLEGSDQHRGWFQSSLLARPCPQGRAPFKTVLTHGFLLDETGKAMSKSQGNVIPPNTIIKQYGADILRLWVSSEDYRNDLRIGMDMMNQLADSYRRIRNTFKFILGNLSDFTPDKKVPYEKLSNIDKWLLHKLHQLSEKIIEHYENFEFHLVYRKVLNFCAVELSSIYFDVSKDILYIESKDSEIRRGNQTVLHELYISLVRFIAPILPFTAEEIWQFMGNKDSIHVETYHRPHSSFFNEQVFSNFESVVEIKQDVLKALENKRRDKVIKTSLEANVSVSVKEGNVKKLLLDMGDELKRFFQVAKVTIVEDPSADMPPFDKSFVGIQKTDGKKCIRCWNFSDSLGPDSAHPELCPRCTSIITK